MPPFRNPFGRKAAVPNGVSTVQDENARPASTNDSDKDSQRASYENSRASSSLSIKGRKEEPTEYKLSGKLFRFARSVRVPACSNHQVANLLLVVNDSGVYLPVQLTIPKFPLR